MRDIETFRFFSLTFSTIKYAQLQLFQGLVDNFYYPVSLNDQVISSNDMNAIS